MASMLTSRLSRLITRDRCLVTRRYLFGVNSKSTNSETNDKQNSNQINQQNNDVIEDKDFVKQIEKLKEENDKSLELIKEMDDKYKRALAEAENTRIRMRRQVEDAKVYAIQAFCKDLLEVADVLHTAVESVPKDLITDQNQVLTNLFKGLEMTEHQLESVFKRHGLTQLNPIGLKFNPNEHHALFETVEHNKEPGSVATVTQIGYKLHERTLRPAMVGVVKASNE